MKKRGLVNFTLLFTVVLLIGIGLLMLYSAGSYSAQVAGYSPMRPVLKQLVGVIPGFILMVIAINLDYHIYRKKAVVYGAVAVSVFLLIIVLIPGIGVYLNGSRRWIDIAGVITVQPGEIAKFAFVLFAAYWLDRMQLKIRDFKAAEMPVLVVVGVMFGLIMLQPNLSTAGSLAIVAIIMLVVAGVSMKQFAILGVAGTALGGVLAYAEPYRAARMMSFLNPWEMATTDGYQLVQSLIAIGSGGLWGTGIGQSRQKLLFLTYAESDFIFAIVAEELGLIGGIFILALFAVLVFSGYRIAIKCRDRFGTMLAAGITSVFFVQVVINIAVVSGVFPTTGLPLPFFSAGGTSIMMFMGAIGVLLNVSRYPGAQSAMVKARQERRSEGEKSRRLSA